MLAQEVLATQVRAVPSIRVPVVVLMLAPAGLDTPGQAVPITRGLEVVHTPALVAQHTMVRAVAHTRVLVGLAMPVPVDLAMLVLVVVHMLVLVVAVAVQECVVNSSCNRL